MFRIASTSKIFVALVILQLQEQGKLNFQDRVRDLIPKIEFINPRDNTNLMLVEHLSEHTTGGDKKIHLAENLSSGKARILRETLDIYPHSRISRWLSATFLWQWRDRH